MQFLNKITLVEQRSKIMENLRLYFLTYNVGTSAPEINEENMKEVLGLSGKISHDFYVLSLQEVKAQPQNMLMSALFDDPWTTAFRDMLKLKDYIKIKTIRLQGLLLSVFCLRKHLLNLRDVESEYTRTGLSGMWGNKGAVSIRISIYGCSLCFVNSHLSAHENMLKDRVDDYNDIIKGQEFHVNEHTQIFFHDYVFWMGDLNFRLMDRCGKTPEEIDLLVQKGETDGLFEFDELQNVMKTGEAFSELTEAVPKFPPTFKFEVGTNYYDHKRKPAWTDRILYKVNSNNYENVVLQLEQKSYTCHSNFRLSDHKPVTADFIIKVFADYTERAILFDKIAYWTSGEDNTISYKLTKEIPPPKEDWIGVFKDDFSSLDEYIIYEYVSKSIPVPVNRSPHHSSETSQTKFTLTFSELPGRPDEMYRLIYFSQSEENVQSVLGISDPFTLKEKKND